MILRWTLSNILHFLLVTFHAIHGNKTDLNTTTHFAKVDAVALNSQPHTIPTSTNQNQDQKSFIATYVTHTGREIVSRQLSLDTQSLPCVMSLN